MEEDTAHGTPALASAPSHSLTPSMGARTCTPQGTPKAVRTSQSEAQCRTEAELRSCTAVSQRLSLRSLSMGSNRKQAHNDVQHSCNGQQSVQRLAWCTTVTSDGAPEHTPAINGGNRALRPSLPAVPPRSCPPPIPEPATGIAPTQTTQLSTALPQCQMRGRIGAAATAESLRPQSIAQTVMQRQRSRQAFLGALW